MSVNAFELFNEKGNPCGIWCCGNCRKLVLSPAWTPSSNEPKSTQEAAEACCRLPICETCGKEFRKQYSNSTECRECYSSRSQREAHERYLKLLESAVDVTDTYDGPVHLEHCTGGDMGDGYFTSADYAAEYLADIAEDYAVDEDGYLGGCWAFACHERHERLDLDHCIENLCSDGYEEMPDNLTIPQSLVDAVAEFNETNKSALTVYEVDYKRKVRLKVSQPTT